MRATCSFVFGAAAALTVAGCGSAQTSAPDAGPTCAAKGAPVDVVVQAYDFATKQYADKKVTLTTPTDVCTLQGPVVKFMVGAKLNVDDLGGATTPEQMAAAVRKEPGSPIQVSFQESGDILTPADATSMEAVTAYYAFERAFSFFNAIGSIEPAQVGTPLVYLDASFTQGGATLTDNMMFMPLLQSFVTLPEKELNLLPLAENVGVVGHQYAHAVFNWRVEGEQQVPRIFTGWVNAFGATPGANLYAALQEGQADLFGTGVTCTDEFGQCNLTFIGDSLPTVHADARRIDVVHCLDAGARHALTNEAYSDFGSRCQPFGCAYEVGTVFASAVWRAAQDAQLVAAVGAGPARKLAFQAVWNAQTSATPKGWRELVEAAESSQAGFTLGAALDAVVAGAADPKLKAALCSAFLDRFGLAPADLPSCPTTTTSYGECP